eukprot:m.118905 g.118905  ORF g.118905 m.118905 type:complete len:66 (+) comp52026_c0_seq4:729-926(+)
MHIDLSDLDAELGLRTGDSPTASDSLPATDSLLTQPSGSLDKASESTAVEQELHFDGKRRRRDEE